MAHPGESLVYLAGPISGLTYNAADGWRTDPEFILTLRHMGFEALSPLEGYEDLSVDDSELDPWFETRNGSTAAPFTAVQDDLRMIRECDAVIANLLGATRPSIGTMAEMGYAHALDKPIVVVMSEKRFDDPHDHPFVYSLASEIVSTLNAAAVGLPNLLGMGMPGATLP